MPKIRANECEFYYEERGRGQEPLLFLNGILQSTESWHPYLDAFGKDFRVLLHDFRGQLMSEKPDQKYSMEMHAEDVKDLMDELGYGSAHIVGTSYGSEVGMILSYKYPERVKTLSVIAGISEHDERTRGFSKIWRIGARLAYQHGYKKEFYDFLEPIIFSPEFIDENRKELDERRNQLSDFSDKFFVGFERLVDAFLGLDITENLEQVEAPTLVVSAEDDILKRPKFGRLIAEKVPKSEFFLMENAGHALILEKPNEFVRLVREFIGDHVG